MPFNGPDDSKLPSNIKKLPVKKRRQFVAVFNSAFSRCGGGKKCEGQAFRAANGAVKELSMDDKFAIKCPNPECDGWSLAEKGTDGSCPHCKRDIIITWKDGGEDPAVALAKEDKHGDGYGVIQAVDVMPNPAGGSQSFGEYDDWEDARDREDSIETLASKFRIIFRNIMDDPEDTLATKANRVESAAKELGTRVTAPPEDNKGLLATIKGLVLGKKADPAPVAVQPGSSFFVVKDKSTGRPRWVALSSNKYEDREKEIFPEAAHREYAAYVDHTKDYPELWLWHTPGSKSGEADMVSYADGFIMVSGLFDEGFEAVAESLSKMKGLGVSHGFSYPEKQFIDGIYHQYRTFEISPLPMAHAANVWTDFSVVEQVKEATMPLDPEKREFLVNAIGEERTVALEGYVSELSKGIEGSGVSWKDLSEMMSEPVAAAAEAPAETPAATAPPADDPTAGDPKVEEGATAPTAAAPAAGDGAGETKPKEADVLKGLKEVVETAVATAVSGITDRLAELEKSDDEKIATLATPKAARSIGATRPTEGNPVKAEDAAEMTKGQHEGDGGGQPVNPAAPYIEDLVKNGRTVRAS